IAPGITGLVGANGAGKSTLIKILLGLLPPTSGRAVVLGHNVVASGERIRTLTGYMPEHDCLPPDVTGTEFVTHLGRMSGLPATPAKERAAESLRHVGLYEERYRQVGTYSTGMKQRVKLAQALVGDPRLLLLDEPTIGLDPAGRSSMLDLISRIGAEFGISIMVSSHLLGEIEQICDQLVVIDGGKLLRSDTMTSFTKVSQVLLVEVGEGRAALQAELTARGLEPRRSGRGLLVRIDGDATYDMVRDAVADLGLPLNRLEQQRRRVEELFRDNGDEEEHGDRWQRRGGARNSASGRYWGHPRSGLPALRGGAPGPGRDYPGTVLAQPALGVRDRPRRQGQDRADPDVRADVPARDRERDCHGATTRSIPDSRLRHLPLPAAAPGHADLLGGAGAGTGVRGPGQPRAAAVPVAADAPPGLPAGQVRRVHRRVPAGPGDTADPALRGQHRLRHRRVRDLGPDQSADSRDGR